MKAKQYHKTKWVDFSLSLNHILSRHQIVITSTYKERISILTQINCLFVILILPYYLHPYMVNWKSPFTNLTSDWNNTYQMDLYMSIYNDLIWEEMYRHFWPIHTFEMRSSIPITPEKKLLWIYDIECTSQSISNSFI